MSPARRLLALLVPPILGVLSASPNAQQVLEDRVLVDHDYGFRLKQPGVGWSLLGEEDVSALAPDALAGACARATPRRR